MSEKYWPSSKEEMDRYINDHYIEPINKAIDGISKLHVEELITEFRDISNKVALQAKVQRIIGLCLKSGKINLAEKIERKYRSILPKSDLAMAFAMSLYAAKRLPK